MSFNNIKEFVKEHWSHTKVAIGIGFVWDLVGLAFDVNYPFFLMTFFCPIYYTLSIIFWETIIPISYGVEKMIKLIPDSLVDLTPNWLKRLLQSSTFWLWTWSIGSLIIVSLIISN